MKKTIIMLAILSLFTVSAVSCGTDAAEPSAQPAASSTTAATETTAETTFTAETVSAGTDTTAASGNTANNTVSAAQGGNTTTVKDEGQTSPVINPEFRLFGGYVATQNDDLNMRKEPDPDSEVIEKIPYATQLDIYSCDTNGWYLVIFNNKKGYVSAEFIKEIESYDGGAGSAAQPNQYGFYPVIDPPASSISVASLSGTWKAADDIPETLEISRGSDLYSGNFTWTGNDGYTIKGTISLEYLMDHDIQQFYFTFYDNSGVLWNAFSATGEVPLNDIYAGQSGSPHFVRKSN